MSMNTGQSTKTMYLLVSTYFDDNEVTAAAPAQEREEDCENLKLDFIRDLIEKKPAGELDGWELDFLKYLKAGDDDMASTEAEHQPSDWGCCHYENLMEGRLTVVKIEVPL